LGWGWKIDKLLSELERLGLVDFHGLLAAQDIEADMLSDLTDDDLREIGLSLGQRNRFRRALAASVPVKAPAAQVTERRQLTTLFCDLVGSTRLATLLDPEDLREVIQAYHRTCSEMIRAHGGHIAYSQGDGLMAYFGFPQAGEDDPERSIRAGLDLCQKLGHLKTASPEPLRVRVGIATGIVVVGDADDQSVSGAIVVGETPNLAARLQQVAEPNEVIIAEATRRLGGAMFDYESRGALDFKGFSDPVPVYRVIGESAAPSRFEAQATAGLNPIVGRDEELKRLRRLWRSALAGEGGFALVGGEPGIGKSRLARAFIEQLRRDKQRVLQWHCAAHLSNRPLHPVVRELEMAAGITRGMPAEARRSALETYVANFPGLGDDDLLWLADLLGLHNPDRPDLDAATRARLVNEVLLRRIDRLATDAPTLILLEDAHWADAATVDLLTALAPRLSQSSLMLLVTHRPEFVPPWPAAQTENTISLGGIDQQAGDRLLNMVAQGRTLPPALARMILDKAGGVPLFVEELAKTVLDSVSDGAMVVQGDGPIAIPATLQDSLMARLDRLGPAKELAQLGSVIGREFNADMLRTIAPDHADIENGLRLLCASGLAFERSGDVSGAIMFHHALIQDTAYEALLKKRRREIHRAIADAMLGGHEAFAGTEPETIARHCSRGGLDEAAMHHWLMAGMHALDRAANAPALTYLNSALEHLEKLPEDEARSEVELKIQMALAPAVMSMRGWADPEVERACRRAHALAVRVGDRNAEMGAAWGLWTNNYLRGDLNAALVAARHVGAIGEADGSSLTALAAAQALSYSYYSRGEVREALQAAEAGLARFDEAADAVALRNFQLSPSTAIFTILSNVYWFLGDPVTAEEMLRRAHARADTLSHPPALAHTLCVSSFHLLFQEDWARLAPVAERALRLAEAEGFAFWAPMAGVYLAFARQGDHDAIAETASGFIDGFGGYGYHLTLSQFEGMLGRHLVLGGHADRAEQRLTAAIASADARAERCYMPELLRTRGEARLVLGDAATAAEDFAAARALAIKQGAVPLVARAERSLLDLGRTVSPTA
jgi:class 3 adenylate cyclase/tetratricopeptide (TPR) repeat protein